MPLSLGSLLVYPALLVTPAFAQDTAAPPPAPAPAPVTVTEEEMEALRQRLRQLEQALDQQMQGTEEAAAEEIPLDLETKIHGYADTTLRSYLSPGKQRPLTFRLGSFDLKYDANLDRTVFFTGELYFEALDDDTFLRIEKVDISAHLSDALHISAGKNYTPLTYQSQIGIIGAYRFLSVTIPETMEPEHSDPTLPMHAVGMRIDGEVPIDFWQLAYVVDVSNGRSGLKNQIAHVWDYDWMKAITVGGFLTSPGGVTIGAAGYIDKINALGEIPEGMEGLTEDAMEVIGAPRFRYQGAHLNLLAETFFIYHSNWDTPSDGVLSISGYAEGGYRFKKFMPYARFEHNDRRWDSVVYRNLSWPHGMTRGNLGFRYDFAVHAAVKVEYGQTYEKDINLENGGYSVRAFNPSILVQLAAGF